MKEFVLILITWFSPNVDVARHEMPMESMRACEAAKARLEAVLEADAAMYPEFGYILDCRPKEDDSASDD